MLKSATFDAVAMKSVSLKAMGRQPRHQQKPNAISSELQGKVRQQVNKYVSSYSLWALYIHSSIKNINRPNTI